jgi:hypothetical protein
VIRLARVMAPSEVPGIASVTDQRWSADVAERVLVDVRVRYEPFRRAHQAQHSCGEVALDGPEDKVELP